MRRHNPKSKALKLPFKPNKFQPLQHCDNIANYYADVLFALFTDVWKEWKSSYHCIVKKNKKIQYIKFSNDLKKKRKNKKCPVENCYMCNDIYTCNLHNGISFSSPLQNAYRTVNNPKRLKEGTLIFSSYSKNRSTVSNIAILFVYGDYKKRIITRHKNYFTIENSLGDKTKYKYSDGGSTGTGRTKAENFRKISLTALMKKASFGEGRKLGQRSKSVKKQAAARANGMKVAICYKAKISNVKEWKIFKSRKECFDFFDVKKGTYKLFNNYMALKRATDKGKYEISIDGIKIVIFQG